MVIIKRKYIDELGIKYEDTPQGWNTDIGDSRFPEWEKQREEWGFDERETWNLTYAFELWLYERLKVYDEINIVDTRSDMHQFEYRGAILDFQDCIDRMLEGLKIKLTDDNWWKDKTKKEQVEDILPLFVLCYNCLWW